MKVLFQIRKDYNYNIAGDSIVLKNLRENLINLGVHVDIHTDTRINLRSYDIVHIFNIMRIQESFKFMENAKASSKKIVLSPIYWDMTNYYTSFNLTEKLEEWQRANKKRQVIFDHCDIFLPHCKADEGIIIKHFGNSTKSIKLPYGVKRDFIKGDSNIIKKKYGIDDYILCIGRIGSQKNQYSLIKALLKEDITLILTGQINDKAYLNKCLDLGHQRLIILESLKPGELNDLFKGSRTHVLPSWYEYPGLVNLEAGLSGCNVVTTEIGTTKDVFKDYVWYCNPADIGSIHDTVMEAFESENTMDFREYLLENHSWHKIALRLKDIYKSLHSS